MEKDKPSEWIHPVGEFVSSRRHLPHIELAGSHYFTTSTTKFRRELTPAERDLVLAAVRFMDGTKYELDAAVIMPDHFHLILKPLQKNSGGCYCCEKYSTV